MSRDILKVKMCESKVVRTLILENITISAQLNCVITSPFRPSLFWQLLYMSLVDRLLLADAVGMITPQSFEDLCLK